MTNVIDISDRFPKQKHPDTYLKDPYYDIGEQFLIMGAHDQFRLIKDRTAKLIQEGLTDDNVNVLDLTHLIFVAEHLIRGLILPFGGFRVTVLKNEDNPSASHMVVMSRINHDELHAAASEGRGPVPDFRIKVFWAENSIDVDGPETTTLKNVNFVSNPNSSFCKEMLTAIANNIEDFAKVHGTETKVNYPTVFTFIPYSVNHKIGVVFDTPNIRKREDNKLE